MEALLEWRRNSEFLERRRLDFCSPFSAGEKRYFQTSIREKVFASARERALAAGGANQDPQTRYDLG